MTKTGFHLRSQWKYGEEHGLFAGDLQLEGARLTRNLYPVYVTGATEASAAAIKKLRDFGILSFGKQGGLGVLNTTSFLPA